MLSVFDPNVRLTVLKMASQIGGKTEILLNTVFYHMHWRPTNTVIMYPTIDSTEKFSKKKFDPNLKASGLDGLLLRDSTIIVKNFIGGSVFMVGANSTTALRQASGEVLIADEIDDYVEDVDGQGDPLELLWKRGESYPGCIKIVASTPTIEGSSRIDTMMNESDYGKWFGPCRKCNGLQTLEWSRFIYKPGKEEDAFWECLHCNNANNDEDRLFLYYHGDYQSTKPFDGTRGYDLNGLYCPWPAQKGFKNRIHQFAIEWQKAQKKEGRLKVWFNTFLCEVWKLKTKRLDPRPLMARCERYGPELPAGVLVLVIAADIQDDRIEAELLGFGMGEECWGIEYKVFMGDPDLHESDPRSPWFALDEWTQGAWQHPCGSKLRVAIGLVDMGHKPRQVIKFTRARQGRRIYACAGSKTHWAPLAGKPKKSTIKNATKFEVGGDVAKEIWYSRLELSVPGPRYCHFPVGYGYDETYFDGLTAERLEEHIEDGILIKREWKKRRDRNEPLDIRCYALAALEVLNVAWDELAKKMVVKPADGTVSTEPETADVAPSESVAVIPPRRPAVRRRSNWVNGWR